MRAPRGVGPQLDEFVLEFLDCRACGGFRRGFSGQSSRPDLDVGDILSGRIQPVVPFQRAQPGQRAGAGLPVSGPAR